MSERWSKGKLNRSDKPTLLFKTYAEALVYAAEMAKQHSRGDYAVFECVGRYISAEGNQPGTQGLKKSLAPAGKVG